MPTKPKQKRISYWEARFLQGRIDLQAAVREARRARPVVGQRQTSLTGAIGGDERVFLNSVSNIHGMLFGQVVLYEPGRHHQAIRLDEGKGELDLVAIAPTIADERARAEFLQSVLYFGVLENHVVLLQSLGLFARELENYLNWLLSADVAGVIQADDGLSLVKGVDAAIKNRVAQDPPSKIRIGTALFESTTKPRDQRARGGHVVVRPRGPAWSFLDKLSEGSLDDLRLDDSIDPESIKVFVEVRYKRKSDAEAGKVMEELTHALRHLHSEDVSVTLPKTGVVKGDQLYLSTNIAVQTVEGIIAEQDLYRHMHDWLESLLERRVVG